MLQPLRGRGPRAQGRTPNANDPRGRRNAGARSAGFLEESDDIGFDELGRLYIKDTSKIVSDLANRIAQLESVIKAAGLKT